MEPPKILIKGTISGKKTRFRKPRKDRPAVKCKSIKRDIALKNSNNT